MYTLKPEQQAVADWLPTRTEAFLWLPVGFGKTLISLHAFAKLREQQELYCRPRSRALVVSTKEIVAKTWPNEILKFDFPFLYASADGRVSDAIDERPDVLGVNFESLSWLLDYCDEHGGLPDVLIIDEITKLKDSGAARTRKLIGQRRRNDPPGMERGYVHRFTRRWGLTATPTSEGYVGLWAQEACVSPRRRLGFNVGNFRARFCVQDESRKFHIRDEGAEAEIERLIDPITYTARGDFMDLPPPTEINIRVPWDADALEQYEEMENELCLQLEEADDETLDDGAVVAPNIGVLLNKLRQMCSGFIYRDDGTAEWLRGGDAKLDALADLVDRLGDSTMVVFTQFTASADRIAERFGDDVHVGLPRSLDDWDAGRASYRLLVLHPRSAAHGINLQHGSSQICFYELPWSREEYDQAIGRLYRRGQTQPVTVHRLTRPASVEGDVWAKLRGKAKKLSQILERVGHRHGRAGAAVPDEGEEGR